MSNYNKKTYKLLQSQYDRLQYVFDIIESHLDVDNDSHEDYERKLAQLKKICEMQEKITQVMKQMSTH